ncbi:MAG: transposase [Candidatus Omnitrophota bacterium]
MIYHVVNKSIAEFVIFNNSDEFSRMLLAIRYYQIAKQSLSLSQFTRLNEVKKNFRNAIHKIACKNDKLVEIIAYCLMPTHLHLTLKELKDNGISKFMNDVLNSYTRYFNLKHKRKGPLWEGGSKKILIETDEQLFYVTSYIHLNPVTSYLVDKPEEWPYSSYKEYLQEISDKEKICDYSSVLDINPSSYKKYVESNISYQRELAKMKKLTLE